MSITQQYRLTQDTAAVNLAANGQYSITQLHIGAVVIINGKSHVDLSPEMIEIESEGRNYALFASDLAERSEPMSDDGDSS